MTPEQYKLTQKVVPDHVCARCRKPFEIGNRIQAAWILVDPHAYNPGKLTERGLTLGTDSEFVHCSCSDPFLSGKDAGKILTP
jgi:hypothetical protein